MLVEIMNGSIIVESVLGRGSTFTATMQVGRYLRETDGDSMVSDASSAVSIASSIAQAQVLVVEDNNINALIMKRILEKFGVENVVLKSDGLEGLQYYTSNSEQVDIILMDCAMPRMSGIEATQHIREFEAANFLRRVPVIAVTASAAPCDIETCLQAGFDDHIAKPYTHQRLQQALLKYCTA